MEEMTIVYFIVDKEGRGRHKRRGEWQYYLDSGAIYTKAGPVKVIRVRLPAYCYRKKRWKRADWTAYLRGLSVPPEGREVTYLFSEEAAAILQRTEEPLSLEWLLFLIDRYHIAFDALVLLADREMETEALIAHYVRKARYIGVVTENQEEFEDQQEELLSEYGFLLDVSASIRELRIPMGGKLLIIAGCKLYDAAPLKLPEGIWLSMDTPGEAGKGLCARAKEMRYIGMHSFFGESRIVFDGKQDTKS